VIERDHWEPSEWPREPRAGDSAARRKASNAAGQVNSGLIKDPFHSCSLALINARKPM